MPADCALMSAFDSKQDNEFKDPIPASTLKSRDRFMAKFNPKKIHKYIEKSSASNVAKSTRRFFFNHLFESMESRSYFHVDQMYGAGSGVLIKIKGDFFVLTARHVIRNNTQCDFQNESPFWIPARSRGEWSSLYDFLFPKRLWNIGELISSKNDIINNFDLCLVEMFQPQKFHMPDHFIEINEKHSVLTKKDFFEGQFLLTTGYPIEKNNFDYTPQNEKITHTTLGRRN